MYLAVCVTSILLKLLACLATNMVKVADDTEDVTRRTSTRGKELSLCDRPGYFAKYPDRQDLRYPSTGFQRDNYCGSMTEDTGSHYVCVELPYNTTEDGKPYTAFWTTTGQARSSHA